MKKKLVGIGIFIVLVLAIIISCSVLLIRNSIIEDNSGRNKVLISEISRLTMEEDGSNPAASQLSELKEAVSNSDTDSLLQKITVYFIVILLVLILFITGTFIYIYHLIVKPFCKLEKYAEKIADGNFDEGLDYERTNFFGAFTWSFDHMRKEIVRARAAETYAIQENKTVIASLSHDIKTPISSIRAYAEGLEAGMDTTYEKRVRYLNTIMSKCDEVTKLTNDLVIHSLSELSQLSIECENVRIDTLLEDVIKDIEFTFLTLQLPFKEAELSVDRKRFAQVIENILNNARKYSDNSNVDIWTELDYSFGSEGSNNSEYRIVIRDHGEGIPPEDMPFIMDKFYRGRNAGEKEGSGLGLFIVNYLMQKMNGKLELINHDNGLEVVLHFNIGY